ncbi:MAG: transporter substrate-binding domain-containing protein, partial [Lachnospiraceae bacterium]|nr:transporter substrate-binding domain-containing protein [Lachnospiraceae bacterium]
DAFASEEYAIAVNKDNTELLDTINEAIDTMLEDGTISEIAAQYAEADDTEEETESASEADTEATTETETAAK